MLWHASQVIIFIVGVAVVAIDIRRRAPRARLLIPKKLIALRSQLSKLSINVNSNSSKPYSFIWLYGTHLTATRAHVCMSTVWCQSCCHHKTDTCRWAFTLLHMQKSKTFHDCLAAWLCKSNNEISTPIYTPIFHQGVPLCSRTRGTC